ncbi:MAG: acyltransferase, partial [Planctomycetota bacterium]
MTTADPSSEISSSTAAAGPTLPDRWPLLDVLRGLAALWVILYHLSPSAQWDRLLPGFLSFSGVGYLGVTIFFVISGYCMAVSARRVQSKIRDRDAANQPPNTWQFGWDFLLRRAWRIYPPLWCSMLVLAPLPYLKAMMLG